MLLHNIMEKYILEFLGTLFFLYTILVTGDPLIIGIALTLVATIIGGFSGGHVNPVVTIVMFAKGELNNTEVLPYILSQIAGGLAAYELYKLTV